MTYSTENVVPVLLTSVILFGSGLLIIWMARRGADGRLKRNQVAGIRTLLTLSSDVAWRAAHVASEKQNLIAGYGTLVGSVVAAGTAVSALFGAPEQTTMSVFVVAVLLICGWLLGWVIRGAVVGQRAAAQAVEDEGASQALQRAHGNRTGA